MFKDAGGWMRGPWPFRPLPGDDETLGSYLTRAAHGLGVAPVRLVSMVWGSKRPLLYQDLDNHAPPHVVDRIVVGTGLDEARIAAMTFAGLEGRLMPRHWPTARKAWILPVSVSSNDRRRPGMQYCPLCLAEPRPHLRLGWRLAFATCCTRHAVALRERCPTCAAILHPFRAVSLRRCFRCGGDLCAGSAVVVAAPDEIEGQRAYEDALVDGWGRIGDRHVHAIAFFAVMRRLATLAAIGRQAEGLREELVARHGGDAAGFVRDDPHHPVEYLDGAQRRRMFDLARRLAEDWPERFVATCREAGVTRSVVVKDMAYVPFVLDEALKANLEDKPYRTTDAEVAAAAAWLRCHGGAATYRDLKGHCGEGRAAIYRHMDYERTPATPSRWRESRDGRETAGAERPRPARADAATIRREKPSAVNGAPPPKRRPRSRTDHGSHGGLPRGSSRTAPRRHLEVAIKDGSEASAPATIELVTDHPFRDFAVTDL